MKYLHSISFILLVVGGLNWLLIGLFNMNAVMYLGDALAKVVYVLVGLGGIYEVVTHKSRCKDCIAGGSM